MTTFIETAPSSIRIPADRIDSIGRKTQDEHLGLLSYYPVHVDGQTHRVEVYAMAQHVVAMMPADGWECLTLSWDPPEDDGRNGRPAIRTVPVVAWALNPLGEIRPVLPNLMPVETCDNLGLRKVGSPKVYAVDLRDPIEFDDDADWLDYLLEDEAAEGRKQRQRSSGAGTETVEPAP
jgi:hypothetical protein